LRECSISTNEAHLFTKFASINGRTVSDSNGPGEDSCAPKGNKRSNRTQATSIQWTCNLFAEFVNQMRAKDIKIVELTRAFATCQQQNNSAIERVRSLEYQLQKEKEDHSVCDQAAEELSTELTKSKQKLAALEQALHPPAGELQHSNNRFLIEAAYACRRIDVLESALSEGDGGSQSDCLNGELNRLYGRVIDLEVKLLDQGAELEVYKALEGDVLEQEERPRQAHSV